MRRSILAVAAVLGLLLIGAGFGPAQAQDYDSLRNQVDQLRQQVRQLSTQVNDLTRRGARPAADNGDFSADQALDGADRAELFARLDEIGESMRRMNGRLEELEYKVGNVSSGLELVRRESDLRGAGPAAADLPASAETVAADVSNSSGSLKESSPPVRAAANTNVTPASTTDTASADGYDTTLEPRSLGTLPLEPGEAAPRPASGSASGGSSPAAVERPAPEETAVASIAPASPKEQYDAAQKLLKNAQYAEAESAFRAYIDSNPKDANVEKASYWLGETYYARKNYAEASRVYARNVQQWPKGEKAPDNLVKLSLSLISLKRSSEACQFLVVLDSDYPNAAQNVKQAADRARKQAKCT